MSDHKTVVIPGPYGPGHPHYEIGKHHGETGQDAVRRDDDTYMNGWADGRSAWTEKHEETS